jgi:hypothetical protein
VLFLICYEQEFGWNFVVKDMDTSNKQVL